MIQRNDSYADSPERIVVKTYFEKNYGWTVTENADVSLIDMWAQDPNGILWAIEVARTKDWPDGMLNYPKDVVDIPYRKFEYFEWALRKTELNGNGGRGIYCLLPYDCSTLGYMSFSKILKIAPVLPVTKREWWGQPCAIKSVPANLLKICKKPVDLLT